MLVAFVAGVPALVGIKFHRSGVVAAHVSRPSVVWRTEHVTEGPTINRVAPVVVFPLVFKII
jgi:hypothetical protein